ncbi:MAG: peptidyl-tRNA hydrolase [Actinomycetota bacterium]
MGRFGRSDNKSSAKGASAGNSTFDFLVVGLGNPGKQYARTRHNVGEEVVAVLASRHGGSLGASRDHALVDDVRIGPKRVVLAFPTTFMNESGKAVRALGRRYGFNRGPIAHRLIVVHDELDLPPGTVRVKVGGGLGGHNGLRSITADLGTQDYVRVRIGVGKPANKEQGANHVLSKVPAAERQTLDVSVQIAADAVERIVADGAAAAMNAFNGQ